MKLEVSSRVIHKRVKRSFEMPHWLRLHVIEGRRIEAIKEFRQTFGRKDCGGYLIGLKEAKDFIDSILIHEEEVPIGDDETC